MVDRRRFLSYFPKAAVASLVMLSLDDGRASAAQPYVGAASKPYVGSESAIEILMRGHGLLLRCLIAYGVYADYIARGVKFDPKLVVRTATIVKEYLENYHEKMEEEYVFKPMEKDRNNFDSIQVLKAQHGTGHILTSRILDDAGAGKLNANLTANMAAFNKMYRYHSSWEDTVLFPAFDVMPNRAEQPSFEELAKIFDKTERKTFGDHGLGYFIEEISKIESELNLLGPGNWTPQL